MTLFNMMKRSKPRSVSSRSKSGYSNSRNESSDFKPKYSNVKQNLDKYLGLAREAVTTGDRITAESHYQHAEHYLRLINEIKAQQSIAQHSEVTKAEITPLATIVPVTESQTQQDSTVPTTEAVVI